MTIPRVVQEQIRLHTAIVAGAPSQRGVAEHRQKARWNVARRVVEKCLLVPDKPRGEMREEVGRRSYDDAVEIVREALRLHQSLAAAVRAGIEIGMARPLAREHLDDGLGAVGRLLERSIPIIDNFLGVT